MGGVRRSPGCGELRGPARRITRRHYTIGGKGELRVFSSPQKTGCAPFTPPFREFAHPRCFLFCFFVLLTGCVRFKEASEHRGDPLGPLLFGLRTH